MNTRSRLNARAATLSVVAALSALAPCLTLSAHAAPKKPAVLEIWPSRRVLLVLPITLASDWNADAALGNAIIPLAQPQLQKALTGTGKFSTTLPYRFDPVLRRGLTEKRLSQDEINALVQTPNLETSRPIINKLAFDQPVMIAEVQLLELRIGGTPEIPTVQIQASGRLYQQGVPNAVKSVVFTSNPKTGKTPVERLTAAAADAFNGIAAEFVAPPAEFNLPVPVAPAPTTPATSAGTPGAPSATTPPAMPTPMSPIATPNSIPAAPGTPFVPQIPAGQTPLGLGAGTEPAAN